MTIRYTRRSLDDLAEIRAYLAQYSPVNAVSAAQQIRGAIDRPARFPDMGRPGRIMGTRELVIARLPFVAAYRVKAEHVDILAILHEARRWPSGFTAG